MEPWTDLQTEPSDFSPLPGLVSATGPVGRIWLLIRLLPFVVSHYLALLISTRALQWGLTIVVIAVDFWFTRNIAGPLLLGLRWSAVVQDGRSMIILGDLRCGRNDSLLAWTMLFVPSVVWGMASFRNLTTPGVPPFCVPLIGAVLAWTNSALLWKCRANEHAVSRREEAIRFVTAGSTEDGMNGPDGRDDREAESSATQGRLRTTNLCVESDSPRTA
jgi:hypothetical protein